MVCVGIARLLRMKKFNGTIIKQNSKFEETPPTDIKKSVEEISQCKCKVNKEILKPLVNIESILNETHSEQNEDKKLPVPESLPWVASSPCPLSGIPITLDTMKPGPISSLQPGRRIITAGMWKGWIPMAGSLWGSLFAPIRGMQKEEAAAIRRFIPILAFSLVPPIFLPGNSA